MVLADPSVLTSTVPSAPVLTVGAVLSDTYRVVRSLAEGGMGAVYEAEHLRLGRRVAIKVLRDEFRRHPDALARFRREAETVGQLNNPHIVQVFDVHETAAGDPYFVMEFLEGESLASRLHRDGRLAMADALLITSQLASGLASAHQQGVVHRDLKPENVFLVTVPDRPVFAKILDFGIASARHDRPRVTRDNELLGTPEYMAPEQVHGTHAADHRVDQFSLAVVFYEMVTGSVPFKGEDAMAILYRVVHEEPVPLTKASPWVPAVFDAVLARALAKDPTQRFPSVSQFSWALENAARHVGVSRTKRALPSDVPHATEHITPPSSPTSLRPTPARDPHQEQVRILERAGRLYDNAVTSLKGDQLDDAVYAAEKLFDLAVHHRDAGLYELMGRAMPTLDLIFEQRLGPPTTRLSCVDCDPRRLNLTPNAARLLGIVDGGASVADVLAASGMPRRDTVRMLAGLLRRGALRAAPGTGRA